ncbi:MAG: NADP-dependent malic enzyme, partial [Nannocystaceae bacterium]|nr:NADP-dependent malic enzyme [Nannocystaceae bacterium]
LLDIPVFHDDQHGTAIISGAALINAAFLQKKELPDLKVAVSGAGASAVACAQFFVSLGVQRKNIVMCDSTGVIYKGRTERMNSSKEQVAVQTDARTLADAVKGADVFLGLSAGGLLGKEVVKTMAERPIIFALANPDPEIPYDDAKEACPDAIVATGRSDTHNQVNNVLGFPFIFRGALDVSATTINEEMKVAAAKSLAELARRDVPQVVSLAYGRDYEFGSDYIIPKPFDPRVLHWVAPAVADAAVRSGVATRPYDESAYKEHLKGLLGQSTAVMRRFLKQAASEPKSIVFPEATKPAVLQAVSVIVDEGIATPVLVGNRAEVEAVVREHDIELDLSQIEIVDPATDDQADEYRALLYEKRQRRGEGRRATARRLESPLDYALMMVDTGRADGIVAGHDMHYPDALRPALQIVGPAEKSKRIAGMYLILHKRGTLFFGDTTVNVAPDSETLADIAEMLADAAVTFDADPRVAMLSMSNFGSVDHPAARKMAQATATLRERRPDLKVEGELQANYAVNYEVQKRSFPFSTLDGPANVLIFPNLEAGNIAYKLMRELGGITAVGPVLLGMAKPVTVLERDCDVDNIVIMTALTVVQAQTAAGQTD